MTEEEFKIQQKIGSLPRDAILRPCNKCKVETPHVIIGTVKTELTCIKYREWQCLICKHKFTEVWKDYK